MSPWRHPSRPLNTKRENDICFELVKVSDHQSVINWRLNSTTESVRIRLRSKSEQRSVGSCTAGHLLRNDNGIGNNTLANRWSATDVTSELQQLHRRSKVIVAGSTQTTVIRQHLVSWDPSIIWHHPNVRRFLKNIQLCAHLRTVNEHSSKPSPCHRRGSIVANFSDCYVL